MDRNATSPGQDATKRVLNGRYLLENRVGEGGMAVTYRARDLLLNRTVAVKLMREHLTEDPSFVERFRREARAAACLSHENIAGVYDAGQDEDGTAYIVMEFVEGTELKARMRKEGPLPVLTALEIARQIAAALEAAHRAGLVHRDITPRNVLLTPDGKAKVTDFGIAKHFTDSEDTGVIMGSVHYLSPEQARGEATTPACDLYALGAVLFEMLTGHTVFESETAIGVAHKHIYDPPPLPRIQRPEIPVTVEAMVLKLLSKRPADRYGSATEVKATLTQLINRLSQEETVVLPPSGRSADQDATIVYRPGAAGGRHPETSGQAAPPTSAGKVLVAATPPARSSSGGWMIVALFIMFFLVAGAGVYYMMNLRLQDGAIPSANTVLVPTLTNMTKDQALAVLQQKALEPVVQEVESDTVPVGNVISQEPPPNTSVDKNSQVTIVVSKEKTPVSVPVPDVSMKTEDLATSLITAANLKVKDVLHENSGMVTKGLATRTDPPAATLLPPDSSVTLYISDGPQVVKNVTFTYVPATVPDIGEPTTCVKIVMEKPAGSTPVTVVPATSFKPGDKVPPQTLDREENEKVIMRMLVGKDETKLTKHEERTFGPGPGPAASATPPAIVDTTPAPTTPATPTPEPTTP